MRSVDLNPPLNQVFTIAGNLSVLPTSTYVVHEIEAMERRAGQHVLFANALGN